MQQITGPLYKTKAGLYFAPGDFYLDPLRAVHQGVVSHAHFDHFTKGIKNIYATNVTCGLIQLRVPGFNNRLHSRNYSERFYINDVAITLIPAGHILGSAMVLIEHEGVKYLYTGDFKTADDPTCETFSPVAADVLICESTYADPNVIHPEENLLVKQLHGYRDSNVVIGAYVLGKAQRLTHLLCNAFPERRVMVHPDITPFHHFYEYHEISLGSWTDYHYQDFRDSDNTFYVVPPKVLSTYVNSGLYHTIMASSFDRNFNRMPLLRLSDHADWAGFEKLVSIVQPTTIVATHGDGSALQALHKDYELICA